MIELAKEHEIDATKSIQFLDSSLVVPTVVGLPLKLSVDGTAVMDVKIRGKLDLRNIGAAPRSLDIDGSIRPRFLFNVAIFLLLRTILSLKIPQVSSDILPQILQNQLQLFCSAAIEVTGEMGVDAWIAKTGLKLVNTLHTSNIADGKIQIQDGQIFNMDINMPNDRVELLDFR